MNPNEQTLYHNQQVRLAYIKQLEKYLLLTIPVDNRGHSKMSIKDLGCSLNEEIRYVSEFNDMYSELLSSNRKYHYDNIKSLLAYILSRYQIKILNELKIILIPDLANICEHYLF